jgi:carboxylesterase type B
MALNWVKTNIAAFGGNPAELTIMGESAGATSICLHMISPNSFGLYSKAIVESSACYTETHSLSVVNQQAEMVQRYLNCSGSVPQIASCLRAIPAQDLQVASITMQYAPYAVVDGLEIPVHPYNAISAGRVNPVPLLSGNVLNEGTLFAKVPQPLSFNAYQQYLIRLFAVANPLVLEQYPCNSSSTDCWPVLASVIGDFYLVCPTKQLADSLLSKAVPNYAYLFTHTPSWSVQVFPKGGAFHSSEIPFVFSTLTTAYPTSTPAENFLSNEMTGLWTNFGNTGNPNQPRNVSEMWPAYTSPNGTRIVLDTTLSLISAWKMVECEFWNTVYRLLYTTGY